MSADEQAIRDVINRRMRSSKQVPLTLLARDANLLAPFSLK